MNKKTDILNLKVKQQEKNNWVQLLKISLNQKDNRVISKLYQQYNDKNEFT